MINGATEIITHKPPIETKLITNENYKTGNKRHEEIRGYLCAFRRHVNLLASVCTSRVINQMCSDLDSQTDTAWRTAAHNVISDKAKFHGSSFIVTSSQQKCYDEVANTIQALCLTTVRIVSICMYVCKLRRCRACQTCYTRMLRGCYEETAPVKFSLYWQLSVRVEQLSAVCVFVYLFPGDNFRIEWLLR